MQMEIIELDLIHLIDLLLPATHLAKNGKCLKTFATMTRFSALKINYLICKLIKCRHHRMMTYPVNYSFPSFPDPALYCLMSFICWLTP